ncbi:unnamed protein product [Paramecium sonneborni]|uniref:Poly [ADP-ribose] polymerase n=1 Tax=Paramecium sonneborni TaxID=65129 RepID=A0A8S1R9G7_9CILI|nr:unnamed protein product [Paramecium sonneborni]
MRSVSVDQQKKNQMFLFVTRTCSQFPSVNRNIPKLIYTRDNLTINYVYNLLYLYEKELKKVSKQQTEAENIFNQLNDYAMYLTDKLGLYELSLLIFRWIIKHKSLLKTSNIFCLVYINLGSLYIKIGNKQAVIAVEKALNLTQEFDINLNVKTYSNIANALNQMNMNEKAIQVLIKAIESGDKNGDPDNKEIEIILVETYFKYAVQLEKLNKLEDSVKQYQNGIKIANKYIDDHNPQFQKFYSLYQDALYKQNKLSNRAKLLQKERLVKIGNHPASKIPQHVRFLKGIEELLHCADIEVEVIKKKSYHVDILLDKYQDLPIKINLKEDEFRKEKKLINHQFNTYQLKGQEENNISQSQQMIYLQSFIVKKFQKEAIQNNIQFKIDQELYQYEVECEQEQEKADKFFQKLKVTLDHIIILTFKFDSTDEITKIQGLLGLDRMKKKLIQQLNIKKFDLLLSSNISLEDFKNVVPLQNKAQELKINSNQIILICQSKQFQKIKILQKQLNDFVQQSNKFQLIIEPFEINLTFPPDQNYVAKKIKQLQDQEERLEIILQQSLQIEKKKMFFVKVTIQIWIQEADMKYKGYQNEISRLKNEIMLIFFPIKYITLTDKSKIILWDQFLRLFYMNNPLECWTIHKNNELMIIEIQGESDMINEKYLQIYSDLNEFSCSIFCFNCQEQIIKILKKKQKFENLYKSNFASIANQFGKCLLKISGVNVTESTIQVTIFHNQQLDLQLIKQQLQEQFFDQLNYHKENNFDIEDLWQFLGIEKQIFLEQHKITVSKMNKEYYFIGLNKNLKEIKEQLTQIKKHISENLIAKSIDCPKILIFNRLKQQWLDAHLQNEYFQNIYVNYSQELKIILHAKDQFQLNEKYNSICEEIKQLEKKTVSKICRFQEKQTKFFEKHLKIFSKQLEKQYNIIFEFDKKFSYQILSQLEYGSKKIQLISTDITLIECDAIVNFINHIAGQSKGLNQHILDFGGGAYQKFIENVIQSTKQFDQIEVAVFELSQFRPTRYIINVFIPLDINGNQVQYGQNLERNIEALFNKIENNNYHIQTLTIPTLIGENKIQIDNYITNIYLDCIINRFFQSNNLIKKIILNEPNYLQIDQFNLNLQRTLAGQQNNAKFQWQWKNDKNFENYPLDINSQIDNGYIQFLSSNQETTVALNYQITSFPSTHLVNLQNSRIQELSSTQQSNLIIKYQGINKKYYINNEYVQDPLNNYFIIQEQNQNFQFYIFWKKLDIVFNQEGVYQINRITKYKREVQKIPIVQKHNVLVGQNYSFKTKINQKIESYNSFLIQSFDQKLNEKILKEIKTELQKYLTQLNIQIPHIGDQDLEKFSNFLDSVTQRFDGNITQGQKIKIEIFKNKERKVQAQIELIMNYVKQYPKKWIKQSDNFIKVPLQQNSKEFCKIQQNFQKTDNGTITAINRIQNQSLWENYIQERNKLFGIHKNQKNILNKIEQKRYLWHGVHSQHPSVIYKSQKEGFDVTFSQIGLWGDGIYFAENAAYSRNYSYQITQQDDPNHVGMKVMLYCLVTTGRVQETEENRNIRRPNQGYDSIKGQTNGSYVYILYKMDVRRAYPAYEVIYQ